MRECLAKLFVILCIVVADNTFSLVQVNAGFIGWGQKSMQATFEKLLSVYHAENSHYSGSNITFQKHADMNDFINTTNSDVLFLAQFGNSPAEFFDKNPSIVAIPVFAQPLIIFGNFPYARDKTVRLNLSTVADIFCQTATDWATLRPTEVLNRSEPILPVYREEPLSSTTRGLKKIILEVVGQRSGDPLRDCPALFPTVKEGDKFRRVLTAYGMIGAVSIENFTIGYTGHLEFQSYALGPTRNANLVAISLQNKEGYFIHPSEPFAMQESVTNADLSLTTQGDIVIPSGNRSYPIGVFMFLFVRKSEVQCAKQSQLVRFLRWLTTSQSASDVLRESFFTSIPAPVYEKHIYPMLRKDIRCGEGSTESAWNVMIEMEPKGLDTNKLSIALSAAIGFAILTAALSKYFLQFMSGRRMTLKATNEIYSIPEERISVIKASPEKYEQMLLFRRYLEGRHSESKFIVGDYRTDVVMLKQLSFIRTQVDHRLRRRLVEMVLTIKHNNIVQFLGLTQQSSYQSKYFLVNQFCPLGDLRTALSGIRNELDSPIKFGMAKGITDGLCYLHEQGIVHGNLRSSVIYLEADWTPKISEWEVTHIELLQHNFRNRERIYLTNLSQEEQAVYLPSLLWTAPEILMAVHSDKLYVPTKECDVYSYSIILYEILTRELPYEYFNVPVSMSFEYLFAMIRRNQSPLRPLDFKESSMIPYLMPTSVMEVMRSGWDADPFRRPKIEEIGRVLKAVNSEMKRLADLTIVNTRAQIEVHKRNIIKTSEDTIELKKELELTKVDFLTYWANETLNHGAAVKPTFHQVAYVLRCSLTNYDGLCAATHGDAVVYFVTRFYQIVDFVMPKDKNMQRLHSNGDDITIIGAVPSGGVEYAAKIATLALDLLCAVWRADLLDIDWGQMELRIGLACGPLVCGIYGNNHEEFTAFGVPRDEAIEMETASSPYHILMTDAFHEALCTYPEFRTLEFAEIPVTEDTKRAFWLTGKSDYPQEELLKEILTKYPIASGHTNIGQQGEDAQKLHPAKLSLPPPPGSYIQKDDRSGYLIEHFEHNSVEAFDKQVLNEAPEHKQSLKDTPSEDVGLYAQKIFGSMLGARKYKVTTGADAYGENDLGKPDVLGEEDCDSDSSEVKPNDKDQSQDNNENHSH